MEAANEHLQTFERLFPLGTGFQYEFLKCDKKPGLVLHAQVRRTQTISKADDGIPYLRRRAASYPVTGAEQLRRLEYAKGIASFENELVNVSKTDITESPIAKNFVEYVVPSAEPDAWLIKQGLIREDRPTVAGVLLFFGGSASCNAKAVRCENLSL